MNIQEKITEYILANRVSVDAKASLGLEDPLGLDSLSIIRFVSFLEEEFGVRVEDEELVPENFLTLKQVMELVNSKKQA